MYNSASIQKLETLLLKLRKSDECNWNFQILGWSSAEEELTPIREATGMVDHMVILVNSNGAKGVRTREILDEAITLFSQHTSVLFCDKATVGLITEGRPIIKSTIRDYLRFLIPQIPESRGPIQVNYHILRGALELSLPGAVRAPTAGKSFSVWEFSGIDLRIIRDLNSQYGCLCAVDKINPYRKGDNLSYRFSIPGAYVAFDTTRRQHFISEHGILKSDGSLRNFENEGKKFYQPSGYDKLLSYLSNPSVLQEIGQKFCTAPPLPEAKNTSTSFLGTFLPRPSKRVANGQLPSSNKMPLSHTSARKSFIIKSSRYDSDISSFMGQNTPSFSSSSTEKEKLKPSSEVRPLAPLHTPAVLDASQPTSHGR